MKNHESAEDYLEAILVLSKRLDHVRSIDIANELGYQKPSVSIAMKNLRNKNQIEMSDEGYITLTKEGLSYAEQIYEKHILLTDLLVKLGVDKDVASEDACRIEHVISDESFEALKKIIK